MRTENSIRNISISLLSQVIIVILGFVSRKVFLDSLGTEYLGVNGLLTNILSMMSLVEGGIGTSIVYNLYKPLADQDEGRIISLVQLYKKIYCILAIIIFILSLLIYPFIGRIIKQDTSVKYLALVYLLFILKNMISYFNAHKWSLIQADQKGYVIAKNNLIFTVITTISKIIILKITRNYILFLVIEIIIFIVQNYWNGSIVTSRYPYINTRNKYKVDKNTKQNLITNVKAIFLHNIGSYCVFGTDNILISVLINIKTVGLYSNYTMIISQFNALISPIFLGIDASIGNMIATESEDKSNEIFNISNFICFWIYSVATIGLFILIEPFINMCFGENLLIDKVTLIVILINFYITGMRNPINIFKSKAGIFTQDKYLPLVEAIVNLVGSIILVRYFGLAGIFMGTTISTILIPLWTQSKLVYNIVFNESVFKYLYRYIYYILITIVSGGVSYALCNSINIGGDICSFIIKGIICVIVPSIIYTLLFIRSNELKYIINLIKNISNKAFSKFRVEIN